MPSITIHSEAARTERFIADSAVPARRAVTYTSTAFRIEHAGANDRVIGIAYDSASTNGVVDVTLVGYATATIGGSVSIGDRLKSNSDGKLVAISSTCGGDPQEVAAVALQAGSANDDIGVLVLPAIRDLDKAIKDLLASTSNGEGASLIGIEDSAGDLTATTVEAALAEIMDYIDGTTALSTPDIDGGTIDGAVIGGAADNDLRLGSATHDYSAGTTAWTLSASEAKATYLSVSNAGGAADIVAPDTAGKFFALYNGSGQTITIKVSLGSGVAVANTKTALVYHSGSDYVRITSDA